MPSRIIGPPSPEDRGLARVTLFLACVVLLLLAGAYSARAHSWYPWECCFDQDCYSVTVKDVRATPQGWYLAHERITVPYENARPSPDGQFHICRNELGKGTLITPQGKPPCLWVPMGAS